MQEACRLIPAGFLISGKIAPESQLFPEINRGFRGTFILKKNAKAWPPVRNCSVFEYVYYYIAAV